MTRREALGVVVAALLVGIGRLVRHHLILGPGGAWREPGWLEEHLPPLAAVEPAPEPSPRRLTGPLDPNRCPQEDLQLLPGIGPALAERIAAARAQGVHFACARDLQEIRGIGPKLSARLVPYLTFGARDSVATGEGHSASPDPGVAADGGQFPSRRVPDDR